MKAIRIGTSADGPSAFDFRNATLVPTTGSGPARIRAACPATDALDALFAGTTLPDADALELLRELYRHSPLTMRVAALGLLARRHKHGAN